jgi:hypothetical protein
MSRGSRKRVKLNIFRPTNPNAPSVHASYTFVSRSQGLTARSSQILSSQPSESSEQQVDSGRVEEEQTLEYGDYSSEVQEPDFEVEAETANMNKRNRTAGVSIS